MSEIIACSSCGEGLRLPEKFRGMEVRCPACQTCFQAGQQAPAAPLEGRMAGQVVIDNPILNSPYREPTRHFRFDADGQR